MSVMSELPGQMTENLGTDSLTNYFRVYSLFAHHHNLPGGKALLWRSELRPASSRKGLIALLAIARQIAGGRRADLTYALAGIAGAFVGFHLFALLLLTAGVGVLLLGAIVGAALVLWGWRAIIRQTLISEEYGPCSPCGSLSGVNSVKVATLRIAIACTSDGNASTLAVSTTCPPLNDVRKASLSSLIRCVLASASLTCC